MPLKYVTIIALLLFFTGCSGDGGFKPDTPLSESDLCIITMDEKQKVCYGMEREEAEKVLGQGEKSSFFYQYDHGVDIIYREGKTVALIRLTEGSEKMYRTVRGSKVGDLKQDVFTLYGKKYAIDRETEPHSIDYVYDVSNQKFLAEISSKNKDFKTLQDHYFVSAGYNDDGSVVYLYVSDLQAIMYLY
ncbi:MULTISPECIES: hypothetical protein [unclassified Paenibacillus]|uniref:hypothetical protein n=1 Tax=unclassified Paenibacillus TaxID=185978 RepID=UPI001C116721|nr:MULTISPECIES: hypothetical protein [unclassified Paenibacillus]MBU5444914.1 hypothetical protein [Paenibacillus sp. MSJ-34]CAH0120683.1 hypothetical protein PAE9249_03204 [Paenibacillus sp. CECT 9249]